MKKDDINTNIAENFQYICNERDITTAELVKEITANVDIGKDTLYYMISGGKRQKKEHITPSPVSYRIDSLSEICDYLGISIDGLISSDKPLTTDPDIQQVCEYTGLNEEAVKCLHNRKKLKETNSYGDPINRIVTDFLPVFNEHVYNYILMCLLEKLELGKTLDYLTESIDSLIENKRDLKWLKKNLPDAWVIRSDTNDLKRNRKSAIFDLDQLTLEYIKMISKTNDLLKLETEAERIITEYESLFYTYIKDEKAKINHTINNEAGGNYGEHNQND